MKIDTKQSFMLSALLGVASLTGCGSRDVCVKRFEEAKVATSKSEWQHLMIHECAIFKSGDVVEQNGPCRDLICPGGDHPVKRDTYNIFEDSSCSGTPISIISLDSGQDFESGLGRQVALIADFKSSGSKIYARGIEALILGD